MAAVLSLWIALELLNLGIVYQRFCISNIYSMVHKSSKITVK